MQCRRFLCSLFVLAMFFLSPGLSRLTMSPEANVCMPCCGIIKVETRRLSCSTQIFTRENPSTLEGGFGSRAILEAINYAHLSVCHVRQEINSRKALALARRYRGSATDWPDKSRRSNESACGKRGHQQEVQYLSIQCKCTGVSRVGR